MSLSMIIPERCKQCIHCKITDGSSDIKIMDDCEYETVYYCDFIDYWTPYGTPVPYPYFYRKEKDCRGFTK